ncbi:MAG: polysaccharide biosynthesis protein [Burkholderiales bacterium]|nr:polysaccharide biosynthesis protein [Burkholderiales bacterium]
MDINPRTALAMLHDFLATGIAWAGAFWLRLNLELPGGYLHIMLRSLVPVMFLQTLIFWRFGLYRGIWRYASLHDLRLILSAVAVAALSVPAMLVLLRMADPVPRSVFIISPMLLLLLMGGSRVGYRAWKEGRVASLTRRGVPVLILGAGDAAEVLVRELAGSGSWRVVGLLDDSSSKQGRQIHGVPVRGRLSDLPAVARDLNVRHVIIAMPSASHLLRRSAVAAATDAGLALMTVPSYDDIVSGKVTVSQLRNVELDDLLGRDPVVLDNGVLNDMIAARTILVTGAGGSIGSELCRQLVRFEPKRLILFELSEYALYTIEQELRTRCPQMEIICAVGDVRSNARVVQILQQFRPQVVFHAAAYKHVPLMEEVNAWEALQNNVLGTYVLGAAAREHGVETFVLISTDKAVNPVNVMGASKRLAEMVCQGLQRTTGTRYIMVRFGNVLGSAGSVIPKFRQQIAAGGPVTVTHPDIIRFFMSIPEAAQLVLQAGAMGRGGEIFVLDMGEPVKIVDLARDMIRLSGYTEKDVPIVFTGLRLGEKLFEEVLADNEMTVPTPHPKLRVARASAQPEAWVSELVAFLRGAPQSDEEVRAALARLVPGYKVAGSSPMTETPGPTQGVSHEDA